MPFSNLRTAGTETSTPLPDGFFNQPLVNVIPLQQIVSSVVFRVPQRRMTAQLARGRKGVENVV